MIRRFPLELKVLSEFIFIRRGKILNVLVHEKVMLLGGYAYAVLHGPHL